VETNFTAIPSKITIKKSQSILLKNSVIDFEIIRLEHNYLSLSSDYCNFKKTTYPITTYDYNFYTPNPKICFFSFNQKSVTKIF